jgi:iron complex outermembrane receptor protein
MAGAALAATAPTDLASVPLDTLLDLEVSGASKFELRMSEASSSVTVITADEMRALGYRTLADVLSSVRGLVVSTDRTYSHLGVRGFSAPGDYNTRILLLIDGNRVNDAVFDQAFLGSEFPLDLDLVERVEFIPGQGSAVHGSNALFGVVNVVTRRGGASSASEVAGALGSAQSRQLRVTRRSRPAAACCCRRRRCVPPAAMPTMPAAASATTPITSGRPSCSRNSKARGCRPR